MEKLAIIGRIFYGSFTVVVGAQAVYYRRFNPIILPPNHSRIPGHVVLAYIFGTLLILAGASIISGIKTRPISLLLGTVFLLIVCFYYIPYEFVNNPNYMIAGEWEAAVKELALSGGALVIAGCFPGKNENTLTLFLGKLIPFGSIFFFISIIIFGIYHFLYTKDASTLVPSWLPNPIFWTYLAGVALLGSGIAGIFKIKLGLIAALLGMMILIWVIILHTPRAVASPFAHMGDEVASGFLALAYSGIAFVIAGAAKRKV